jgi:hypothetical protein
MKTLIIAIGRIDLQDLREASGEHLTHLRWLMQTGCYGKLAGVAQPVAATARTLGDQLARAGMQFQIVDMPPSSIEALDAELGKVLGSLVDQIAVCVVLPSGFILATSTPSLQGEREDASMADVVATIIELGGSVAPEWLAGKSFLQNTEVSATEEMGYTKDEEEIVRERLQGLGYI